VENPLILDGEVAIFDDHLISRFERFRKRPEDAASTPPIYNGPSTAYIFESCDLQVLSLRVADAGDSEKVGFLVTLIGRRVGEGSAEKNGGPWLRLGCVCCHGLPRSAMCSL
jgi:hypothetical protein